MQQRASATARQTLQFENSSSALVIYLDGKRPQLSYAVSFLADSAGGGHPIGPPGLAGLTPRKTHFSAG